MCVLYFKLGKPNPIESEKTIFFFHGIFMIDFVFKCHFFNSRNERPTLTVDLFLGNGKYLSSLNVRLNLNESYGLFRCPFRFVFPSNDKISNLFFFGFTEEIHSLEV